MLTSSPFSPISPQARAIEQLFNVTLVVMAAIFVLVLGLVLYIWFRFRRRPGEGSRGEPYQDFGRPRLEILWTVVPTLIVIGLFILTVQTMRVADPGVPQGAEPDLTVIGHQWWWEVRYPKLGVITANEIHIPADEKLLLRLQSADVIHSFWVPQLGRKMDMIPGHPTQMWIQADQVGAYRGECSEYCGVEHAWMHFLLVVQPAGAYAAWVQHQLLASTAPSAPEAERGARLFQQLTCVSCHAIDGTAARARVGPDLTHVASRQFLGAGVLTNTPDHLTRWLENPQAVKPGCYMPNLRLTAAEVRALTAYLETLP
jgi:cytochrome c oxidase subunit 2